jgi:hypothetical protein
VYDWLILYDQPTTPLSLTYFLSELGTVGILGSMNALVLLVGMLPKLDASVLEHAYLQGRIIFLDRC